MQLQDILYSQGFGTRRVCAGLVQHGLVAIQESGWKEMQLCTDPLQSVREEGLLFNVQGMDWHYQPKAYVVLHKPVGFECSQKPSAYPSVYTLLPAPLRQRPGRNATDGVQACGRLDQDTSGLLLLSDDGQFLHRMASPKKRISKVYQVTTRHPVTQEQMDRLLAGVTLNDDPRPVQATACERTDECRMDLTLTQGKYHQVKRMVAAAGNRVEALHRSQVGRLVLPDDLLAGQWRWLNEAELALLSA